MLEPVLSRFAHLLGGVVVVEVGDELFVFLFSFFLLAFELFSLEIEIGLLPHFAQHVLGSVLSSYLKQ